MTRAVDSSTRIYSHWWRIALMKRFHFPLFNWKNEHYISNPKTFVQEPWKWIVTNSPGKRNYLKQECIPVRCIPSIAVAVSGAGGVCLWRGVCWGLGVCLSMGCLPRGVCLGGVFLGCLPRVYLPRGVHPSGPRGRHPWESEADPPWIEFLTHACENITFPQLLLRMVIV